jgi:hypothetical protein
VPPPAEANLIRHWPKPPSRLQNTPSRRSDSQSHPQILRHRHRQLRVRLAPVFPASSRSDLPSIEATAPSLHAKDLMPMAISLCNSLAAAGSSVAVDRPAESWAQDQRRVRPQCAPYFPSARDDSGQHGSRDQDRPSMARPHCHSPMRRTCRRTASQPLHTASAAPMSHESVAPDQARTFQGGDDGTRIQDPLLANTPDADEGGRL